ncbi:MAG TPA: 3-phosphoshikimate 1-carboxyvinyltransferase [Nitrospiraceae bacterium]|nr:MAG: 3-phosphoshikimate 1-carboxyvinyltransferase [Nitrospirae bacterium GWA2_46_11]OGW22864.1 MAG: 3-phosphoshikimate 1-carboxyvinyltransferase [Nitrospirae bacterium GWB2_47_37]HAK89716.1 3-phosphoshikimate 1-carboxyvinyltransferase [Nitrospiraceae bacterium]HCZ11428.1 3-phosphoshikimate 1-carboxyvinyltransferase [Nitrospiraceae bacterium]
MERAELTKAGSLKGEIIPPPDKSISHRAIMFASIAQGKSVVKNFLRAEDPISTMNAFRSMGIEIEEKAGNELIIHGKGLYGLKEPFDVIDCGNSGTTVRLISGILSGNPFFSVLTGDDSLKQRPMARVIAPLKEMGAGISARDGDKYLPIAIKGRRLKAIDYRMPVASAQVKSCLILAGLYADGTTAITELQKSRDHTERMLKSMGADIQIDDLVIKVKGRSGDMGLRPIDVTVPADFSSAAFFIAAALMVPNSEILIKNVCVNPTRTGMLEIIKNMGADVRVENVRDISGEPVADIHCKGNVNLKSVKIGKDIMPSLIDEFPILCVLATQAEGVTEIRGAEELRVKESDRIKAMATELKKLGVEVEEYPDGISIKGKASLKGNVVESYHDHRIAMSLAIAALAAEGTTTINNSSCVDISFPGFFEELKRITN